MKIALLVEGQDDEKALKIFARRILGQQAGIVTRVLHGRSRLLKEEKVHSFIQHDILQEHSDVAKIILCIDSECTPEVETKGKIEKVESFLRKTIDIPISSVVVNHALGGWLLADSGTLQEYSGFKTKINIPASATNECEPKEVMKSVFRKADREFLPGRDNPRIAEKADLGKIAKRNHSFERFQRQVGDP